jgi:hypothetical protein
MAHAYVIQSVAIAQDGSPDPAVSIKGTVDGVAVNVQTWQSAYLAHAATAIGFQNWISPLMLAEFNKLNPTAANPPSGNWSQ